MKSLLILVLSLISVFTVAFSYETEWESFKNKYYKKYMDSTEELLRKNIFRNNLMLIEEHNKLYNEGKSTFTMAINQFADLTVEEFSERLGTPSEPINENVQNVAEFKNVKYDVENCDWRETGCITPVKDQGTECLGASWAFAVICSVECYMSRQEKKLVFLSEQNLIDCALDFTNSSDGCSGGTINAGYNYIINNRGIDTEASYPYTGVSGECLYDPLNWGGYVGAITNIPSGDESTLASALSVTGPVSTYVDANHESFMFYSTGVYNELNCSTTDLSLAVSIIGFGFENHDNHYWLVRNSMGTDWGDRGYIRMSKDKNNQCGIATRASFAN